MVHDAAGNPVSMGTVVANPLPDGLSASALSLADAEGILDGSSRWDAATLAVVPVTPPVPEFVTRWQIRQAMLRRYQITPTNVETFIVSTITESVEQASALIDWRDSPIVRRDHALVGPFVAYLSSLLQTTVDADEFFRYANTLEN